MDRFNPFNFLKNQGFLKAFYPLENLEQMPWLEDYINNILGPRFWTQVMGNQQQHFNKTEVFQTSDEVIVIAEIPGLEKEDDVRVLLKGTTLLLEATIPAKRIGPQPERVVLHNQTDNRPNKRITQEVNLPFPVKSFGTKAIYKNGVLEIRLPKEVITEESHIEVQFL